MTTDQALRYAQNLMHREAQQLEAMSCPSAAAQYRAAADKLDEVRAGIPVDIPDCED